MIAVTPKLFVGDREDRVWLHDLEWVETPEGAFQVIREMGRSALLPYADWQTTVRETMDLLGIDQESIEWAIRTAPRVNEPAPS
jgi:hypothetical protein